jgi:hypothetical protein
MNAYTSNLLKV